MTTADCIPATLAWPAKLWSCEDACSGKTAVPAVPVCRCQAMLGAKVPSSVAIAGAACGGGAACVYLAQLAPACQAACAVKLALLADGSGSQRARGKGGAVRYCDTAGV